VKPGYVYFITFEDEEFRSKIPAIKIGSTYDIDNRWETFIHAETTPRQVILNVLPT